MRTGRACTLAGGGTRTAFADWGWRIPFLASFFLLVISLYIRLKMNESPAFLRMKQEGTQSKAPLDEAFGTIPQPLTIGLWSTDRRSDSLLAYLGYTGLALLCIPTIILLIALNMARFHNGRIAILALLGLVAGQAVVWYTGQFYALFYLQQILKVDSFTANVMVAWSLIIGTGRLHLLRIAVGQDRPQAGHSGRLPACGAAVSAASGNRRRNFRVDVTHRQSAAHEGA